MRILVAMTYFRPYVSGPIVYVERLARELVARGHALTILASQHDTALPLDEYVDGVRIVRVPVRLRISKGAIMPSLPGVAGRLIAQHDAVAIQVPQFEAPLLAALASAQGVPAVLTYHCDVQMPPGAFNRLVDRVVLAASAGAASAADRIVAYTLDYARHSPLMVRFQQKVTVIPPPVAMPVPGEPAVARFRAAHGLEGRRVIGICGRFASEKGYEYLLEALDRLRDAFPTLCVVHAGESEHVIGEESYRERMRPLLERAGERWIRAGVLRDDTLAAFFAVCEVTVLPSVNRTESFGLVQVESMLCGTPVVASDLPGVRVPVQLTGMGRIAPVADGAALAEHLGAVLREPAAYRVPRSQVEREFSVRRTADDYLALFDALIAERQGAATRARFPVWSAGAAFVAALLRPPRRAPAAGARAAIRGH